MRGGAPRCKVCDLPPFAYVALAATAAADRVPVVLVLGAIAFVVPGLMTEVADLAPFPVVRSAAKGAHGDGGVGLGSRG